MLLRMAGFDRFTPRAKKALQYAQEEAARLSHNYVGTEHILLGLVRCEDSVASQVLTSLGITQAQVRSAVEFIIGRGEPRDAPEIGLTPRAKKVIELSCEEARQLKHQFVGTEHLLLGLCREGEGIAAAVLESLGVRLDKVRLSMAQVLNTARGREAHDWLGSLVPPLGRQTMQALDEAELAVAWLQHPAVDVDHLLLGLLRAPVGVAFAVLQDAGVTLAAVAERVVAIRGYGAEPVVGYPEYSQAARKTIERAAGLADAGGHPETRTAHILASLTDLSDGVISSVEAIQRAALARLDAEE
jgi:ATP-dependent Clp protease ATP-binding subunit ClpA